MTVYPGVTIDAPHSSDLDDAIWVETSGAGARVVVSISLVADYVVPGSDLDAHAQDCGFTRYNATSAVRLMLPRHLSEEVLSLVPGPDRQVLVFDIVLDRDLDVASVDIRRGSLRNRGRMSHEEAGRLIESGEGEIGEMLRRAWSLSAALLDKRRRAGSLAYFSAGTGMLTDEEGYLIDLGTSEAVSRAYVVVQEMMILANHVVSERLAREGVHLLFRNHRGNPVADRQALVADLELATQGGPFQAAAGKRLEMMIGKATLGATAQGHFGLNLPVYARMTSPIRRYEDLVNQRILLNYVEALPSPYAADELQIIGSRMDELSHEAAAERSASFKASAERRASRLQQSERFGHLDQNDMTAVIKAAVEAGAYSEGLIGEIAARLANATLTSKDTARLLLAEGSDAEPVRRLVLRHLEMQTPVAVSVLNFLHQDGWIGEPRWQDAEISSGYRSSVEATLGGRSVTHEEDASSKKLAKQRAAVGLLARMAQVEWSPPPTWSNSPPQAYSGLLSEINSKGALIELCQSKGLPSPEFEITSTGPSHAPVFAATAAVSAHGRILRSEPSAGPSRKLAERMAAAALIDIITDLPSEKTAMKNGTSNAKNALQERCQKRGWHLPVYGFTQSGPAHCPVFSGTVSVLANGREVTSGTVSARSRKEAEMLAAEEILRSLDDTP